MHGMISPETHGISPETHGPEAQLASANGGWSRVGGVGLPGQALRRLGQAARMSPLPPGLLMAGAALLDALAITGAGFGVRALHAGEAGGLAAGGQPALLVIGFLALLCPGLATALGANGHAALLGGTRSAMTALGALGGGLAMLTLAALALNAAESLPASTAAVWFALAAPLTLATRLAGARGLRAMPERSRLRAVLVGDGPQAARFAAASGSRPECSLRLLGLVDDRPEGDQAADRNDGQGAVQRDSSRTAEEATRGRSGLPHLGTLETLCAMIRRGEVDQVVVTLPWHAEARIRRVEAVLADYPVDIRLAPDLAGHRRLAEGPPVAGRLRLVRLADRPMSGWGGLFKRLEDYALATVGLAVAAVPMALIALAIRLDSPGPVLFRQRRAGFNNRDFFVLKFRTMHHAEADQEVRRQVTAGDPRVTRVGAILRRTSLDELPQLLNVLQGEMSFIGPRPHAPGTRAGGRLFEQVVARYAARHRVKPGLTGLAQVRGWRGPTQTEEKLIRRVESDLEYIDTWSPWLDLKIVMRTLLAVARMRNAL